MAASGVITALGEGVGGRNAATSLARRIPPKLYHISEIVEYSGVSRQTIHNYTTMGLITESRRTTGGHRLYEEGVFARLDAIENLKRQKKSLREIRAQLATLNSSKQ
jgi:DNA-binding transcriptional MerR regulator